MMVLLPIEQRLFVISETMRNIERYFVHWEDSVISSEEFSSLTSYYFKKATEIETQYDFTLLMWELIGSLRNGHTWYVDKTMVPKFGIQNFILEPTSNDWIVKKSFDEELKMGDLIVSVEGKKLNEWYQKIGRYIGAKKETSRRLKMGQILSYFFNDKNIEVEYFDSKGTLRTKNIHCLDANSYTKLVKNTLTTQGYWIKENKVAYIKIPSFSSKIFEEEALKLINKFKNSPSLIIDLRGNGGGSTPLNLIGFLMKEPYYSWLERARHPEWMYKRYSNEEFKFQKDFSFTFCGPIKYYPKDIENCYGGELIILVDKYTASAAEDFTMPFKFHRRGTILGEYTYGSTGQPAYANLTENVNLGIGSIRAYFPNGDEFEGLGIEPDIKVNVTREDIYNKTDSYIEKALDVLM
ncbi:S41 family peptidase [Cytobacillus sp. FSL R5-0596]|uniref:S41 family peptidase n=1 Tax=Cytobacillus sp. FSL R5-0596 TaxID=2954696 RepID=UPI0030FB35B1